MNSQDYGRFRSWAFVVTLFFSLSSPTMIFATSSSKYSADDNDLAYNLAYKVIYGVTYVGYISNCTVFLDMNGDSSFDPASEPFNVTDDAGFWSLEVPSDRLDNNTSMIRLKTELSGLKDGSCIDVTNALPLLLPLASPLGASVIGPLTTLIVHIMGLPGISLSETQAEDCVKEAFGLSGIIPAGLSLIHSDSISLALLNDTSFRDRTALTASTWQVKGLFKKVISAFILSYSHTQIALTCTTAELAEDGASSSKLCPADSKSSVTQHYRDTYCGSTCS